MVKTKKNRNNKGGKVIASGGFGCVFNPALKCEGETNRETHKISKLMTDKHATNEYEEITNIKEELDSIANYQDYFLIYDATLCRPAKLTENDLIDFEKKCTALPKDNITKQNINDKLDEVMVLNIPNGGLTVYNYISNESSFERIYDLHIALMKLLKNGIIPMNKRHIYHGDIKDSNILIDNSKKARLIDWGLAVNYTPGKPITFPRNWRNRPLQYNVPFSVVIFSDDFYSKYTEYLNNGGKIDEIQLRPFVIDYLNYWMKKRGPGHYKLINEIIFILHSNNLTSISEDSKPTIVETEITLPLIVDYITDVLVHYTKFKSNGDLNLREYLDEVYIEIVDIWGFIIAYYPILEILSNNLFGLNENELKIFNQLVFIFNKYLYTPRHEPINKTELFNDFKLLGNIIYKAIPGKKKTSSGNTPLSSGIKTRKNKRKQSSSSIFKKKNLVKKFKNTFFLSLK